MLLVIKDSSNVYASTMQDISIFFTYYWESHFWTSLQLKQIGAPHCIALMDGRKETRFLNGLNKKASCYFIPEKKVARLFIVAVGSGAATAALSTTCNLFAWIFESTSFSQQRARHVMTFYAHYCYIRENFPLDPKKAAAN